MIEWNCFSTKQKTNSARLALYPLMCRQYKLKVSLLYKRKRDTTPLWEEKRNETNDLETFFIRARERKRFANLLINSLFSLSLSLSIRRWSQTAALGRRQDDAGKSMEIQHAGSGWERRRRHHVNSTSPLKDNFYFFPTVGWWLFFYISFLYFQFLPFYSSLLRYHQYCICLIYCSWVLRRRLYGLTFQ
jgi:hypothetical protein